VKGYKVNYVDNRGRRKEEKELLLKSKIINEYSKVKVSAQRERSKKDGRAARRRSIFPRTKGPYALERDGVCEMREKTMPSLECILMNNEQSTDGNDGKVGILNLDQ